MAWGRPESAYLCICWCMSKYLGVNCHPSVQLEATAGVPPRLLSKPMHWLVFMHEWWAFCYSSTAASHSAPGQESGEWQEQFIPFTVTPFPPASPSIALLCGFPDLSVIPGLTWRRVPTVLLSLSRDVACRYNPLSWFNPSWQLSTTQLLSHSPLVGWGRESEGKSEKTHGLT